MSKKRADRPTAGNHDAGDDDKQQTSGKSARFSIGHQAASSVAAAAASSAAAPPTMPPPRSPAERLYSDMLISVFRFLDLADVISAHASCRSWRDAARKEPSRQITLKCEPDRLAWFCASPLRRHVANFSPSPPQCTLELFASLRAFPALTRVQIAILSSAALASLAALRGNGYTAALAATIAQLPSSLTHLESLPSDWTRMASCAEAQVWMDCIGRLDSLTELKIDVPHFFSARISLQPLLQLIRLRTLHLNGPDSIDAEDCSVIKQMRLTRLSLKAPKVTVEAMQALCTPPHQLAGLEELELHSSTAAHLEVLLCLPALSKLKSIMDLKAVALLHRFSNLRTPDLLVEGGAASDFMQPLTECKQLTSLTIGILCIMTLGDLNALARSLTALSSLRFVLTQFEGLEQQPIALPCLRPLSQLRVLVFVDCIGVSLPHLIESRFPVVTSGNRVEVSLS